MNIISRISLTFLITSGTFLFTRTSLCATETDDRIEATAQASYVFKTILKDDSIRTESIDGKVTLTGTVEEKSHKDLAEYTVAGLPGVTSVDNNLEINTPEPEERSDAWLVTKVKSVLLFHTSVRGTGTNVSVTDGIVTLKGNASSTAQKELTTEYAMDVDGVKSVVNEMTVATPDNKVEVLAEKIDDASVTAQVKWSLMTHRSTSAIKTDVKTKEGIVTVKGTAEDDAEKQLVSKLVTDIKGVTSVVNEMEVK